MIKIICVCGTRPNFVKIAPLLKAFSNHGGFETLLIHTGQHYDVNMSKNFFADLNIPEPEINLNVGSCSSSLQKAQIMTRFEPVVSQFQPEYILVTGDVNSTVACSIVAKDLNIRLIHIEAGQRSHDRTMPEEINRVITDAISDMLFVSEPSGVENLQKEGIDPKKIYLTGNVMIDTLIKNQKRAQQSDILKQINIMPNSYGVLTLHRAGNVDNANTFSEIINAIGEIQHKMTIVFPIHPRTRNILKNMNLHERIDRMQNVTVTEPLGYLDFLNLISNARIVLTDSGGLQKETAFLGIPCITLRENTEWPETLTDGTNHLVKLNTGDIITKFNDIMSRIGTYTRQQSTLNDGKASERIVKIIYEKSQHKQ
ncbi:MAG: UDP-N-acetylglucosamine 2-epimerase (non-hydrolyzing) [Candidatus Latescibacteria bacterium]|nr:UDP-N-acetylglucosamine 2-epimerase (non-hydrolyzing) [Candidatus Latescibacterota bacterium]